MDCWVCVTAPTFRKHQSSLTSAFQLRAVAILTRFQVTSRNSLIRPNGLGGGTNKSDSLRFLSQGSAVICQSKKKHAQTNFFFFSTWGKDKQTKVALTKSLEDLHYKLTVK